MNTEFLNKYDMLPNSGTVLCAVSGGKDSMYLLEKLRELAPEYGFNLCCAHFNHKLRDFESDRDQKFVEEFCEEKKITLFTGSADVSSYAAENGLSIEEAARILRYEFLEKTADNIGALRIATAHTADDNLETVLFNLARGSGLKGICGIPPVRGRIIRPMLKVTTEEVLSYLKENNIPHVEDSSNFSDDYTRNRIRHKIVPELKHINEGFRENIIRCIESLTEDEEFLTSMAVDFINERFKDGSVSAQEFSSLPKPISARILQIISPNGLSSVHINAVRNIAKGEKKHAHFDIPGMRVTREYDRLIFGENKFFQIEQRELLMDGVTQIHEAGLEIYCEFIKNCEEIHNSFNIFYFKNDSICDKISVKSRSPGEKIRLNGRNCTKTLKKLFSEAKLNGLNRGLIPVFYDSKGPIAIYGFGIAERCCPNPGDDVLKVVIRKLRLDDIKT